MYGRLVPASFIAAWVVGVLPCAAQTLAAKPEVFADPVPGTNPSHGELVLGRTTLTSAVRIFAVELQELASARRDGPPNPDTLPANTQWEVGEHTFSPRRSLDLGPERYRLFFDKNDRLVAALTFQLPRPVRRDKLAAHYPTVRFERRGANIESFVAPLSRCISLGGRVRLDTYLVDQLSYVYTCSTKPARQGR
jgi:hypothetical protein